MFTDDWDQLTPDQRFEARMGAWLEPQGVEFAGEDARAAYRERVTMLRDAIELRKPARVPIAPQVGLFPARWGGLSPREAYYEPAKLREVWGRFHTEFPMDVLASSGDHVPCRIFDLLDYRLYDWPGHGVGDDSGYQYNEKEWMLADEYDELIADPSYFWQHTYLPRVFGEFAPMRELAPLTDVVEAPFTAPFFLPFGRPDVREMYEKLLEAGRLADEWMAAMAAMDAEVTATLGLPALDGGATKAPYDILGDTLRGTRGLMTDTFRRWEKVTEACERLVPIAIDAGVRAADATRLPICFIPLHKGADGFLDERGFHELYWPTLKAVLLGLIEQGIVPRCFAEGGYATRLDAISDPDIPAGRMIWLFDATDMGEVRRRLGGHHCFSGNVPGALFSLGDPAQMDDYVRRLIDDVAGDGGFILGSGVVLDEAITECVKTFMEAGLRYGAEA